MVAIEFSIGIRALAAVCGIDDRAQHAPFDYPPRKQTECSAQ